MVPKDSTLLARAIGEAHRRYTRMNYFREGVRGYLFQGRFGSCVLDEPHLLAAARYVELNPVKAGIVPQAGDYPWSSARFHLGVTSRDVLVRDKSLLGLIEAWAEYLRGDDGPRIEARLLRGIRTGRPAGSEQFIEMIERLTGRDLVMRKAGRPHTRASREISIVSPDFNHRGTEFAEFGVFLDQELFTPRTQRLRGAMSESLH